MAWSRSELRLLQNQPLLEELLLPRPVMTFSSVPSSPPQNVPTISNSGARRWRCCSSFLYRRLSRLLILLSAINHCLPCLLLFPLPNCSSKSFSTFKMNINEPSHRLGFVLPFINKDIKRRGTRTSSLKSNRLPFLGWIPDNVGNAYFCPKTRILQGNSFGTIL